ncbi:MULTISPECIES: FtsB family cell division protein [Bacillus]|uniref:Cell division protein DivIVC n=4 Tax=Bacillus thuringiensis TaxID=1428 RepID=A0A1W6WNZ2_BACTU|nr:MULTISPECIES: septum formation initiator family protein [Bacillus]MEC3059373.1 septum formation initiator family protein [Bacillus cereus]AEA16249.1 cell division protein DIVIC [Bacillus thuringiensis serovar chinensis CT-43]AFV18378.1 cell division protein DIVIC [Bacillus thuringiensis Bt407]AGG01325.1 Cell division protein DivIC [Bacillus thuringiensis serovar thuringiensis str. IS5056]ARP57943.1 cell division protein DivIVC [Bacillus thuringiensis]
MGNLPNLSPQQSISKNKINSNKNQQTNKKLRRRLLLALAFMLPMVISIQICIYKQEDMIQEKQITLNKEKKKLSELELIGRYFENDIKTLTESEEGILKFARKLYGFSRPDETIFQITE